MWTDGGLTRRRRPMQKLPAWVHLPSRVKWYNNSRRLMPCHVFLVALLRFLLDVMFSMYVKVCADSRGPLMLPGWGRSPEPRGNNVPSWPPCLNAGYNIFSFSTFLRSFVYCLFFLLSDFLLIFNYVRLLLLAFFCVIFPQAALRVIYTQ